MFKTSFLFTLFFTQIVFANSFLIGHNLGITTGIPEKGTATVGNYEIGYSPSDSLHLATSPWMAVNYNSYSLLGRYKTSGETNYFEESILQFGYIKSDKSLGDYYRQEVGALWWAIKNNLNEVYTLYTTFNFMYFWDETFPFSLRREPGNDQPYQLTISTLHQLKWTDSMGFNFEFGILGLNYREPRLHSGYSFYKLWDSFLLQLGISITASDNNFDRLYERTSENSSSNYRPQSYDYSMHPEIQLQYFF